MSDTKFTPGPWDKFELIIGRMIDNRNRYTSIASIYESEPGYEGEDKANAHLIAAAPDLYEELEKALKNWIELIESGDAGFWDPERDKHVISMRKVLAKARGETQA